MKLLSLSENLEKPPKFSAEKLEHGEYLEVLFNLNLSHSARKTLALLTREGPQNQRTMAQLLGISPQAVSEMVKKLLLVQCIRKEPGKQKNENLITLTELGQNLGLLLEEVIQYHANELFSPLSTEELEELDSILEKLLLKRE